MEHLLFFWHGLALFSGLALMGMFHASPSIKRAKGFPVFLCIYGLISAFLFCATTVLYIKTNIPNMTIVDQLFASLIPLFISALNILLPLHVSVNNGRKLQPHQKYFAGAQVALGLLITTLPWSGYAKFLLPAMAVSIVTLIATLLLCQIPVIKEEKSRRLTKGKLSAVMAIQSITFPVAEILLAPNVMLNAGLTFSLPLIYMLNNVLIWRFKEKLFEIGMSGSDALVVLSAKEQEIAQAVAKGLSNKEIAANLSVSPSTVKNHLYTIFKKLGITNRTALVAIANTGSKSNL